MIPAPALDPVRFLGSVDASRGTLAKAGMRLLDVLDEVVALTGGAPHAVVGGLAQILWARKTHTDDLDVAIASSAVHAAIERVRSRDAAPSWTLPDQPYESDDVFEVAHLQFDGAVVDLLSFRDASFTQAIVETAVVVAELREARFVRPELLLVMHLLRPGPQAALAAVELVLARQPHGGMDFGEIARWAAQLGRSERLTRTLERAKAFELE